MIGLRGALSRERRKLSVCIPLASANDRQLMNFSVVLSVYHDLKTFPFFEFSRDFRRLEMLRKSPEQVVLEFQIMKKAL